MAKKISTLATGTKVKYGPYYGVSIVWQIADKNHSGYPSNSTTLVMQKAVKWCCFDAAEPNNSNGDRSNYGNNRFLYSNLKAWANSDAAKGKWYSAKHSYDAPPNSSNVGNGNAYDTEAGFLNGFSANEKAALLDTSVVTGRSSTDGGGTEKVTCKIFPLSCTEVGLTGDVTTGTRLALFTANDDSRIRYATAQACSHDEGKASSTNPCWYWLRDAYASDASSVYYVYTDGTLSSNYAYCGNYAVLLACNLSSDLLVSDTTDSDGCYTIVYNRDPSVPPSITVPEAIDGGKTTTVTWGGSTDPDGNLTGYKLERQVDGGSWAQIYAGSARTYTDSITFGWVSVAYRVKAYDTDGAESGYKTSSTITVHNNQDPVISGTDRGLGTFGATPPSTTYNVTDSDSSTVTVKTSLDSTLIGTATPTLGSDISLTITANDWQKTLNGGHTWQISADDGAGGTALRTLTFDKSVTKATIISATLPADGMPLRAIANFTGFVADGATLEIDVCNNGYDATPTWEDMTAQITSAQKHFFTNNTKTAAEWGVRFQIKLDRGTATAISYALGLIGKFE